MTPSHITTAPPKNLDNPIVQNWALQHYKQLVQSAMPAPEEMASTWFHDLFIARLFDQEDHASLTTFFRTLPAPRFVSFIPQMLKQWPDWPGYLAGAALPILAAHAPSELCSLLQNHLMQTHVDQLSAERFIHINALTEHAATRDCWGQLIRQMAQQTQAMSRERFERGFFCSILLLNAQALEADTLATVLGDAWRDENRAHAQNSILNSLCQGLFGQADFLDLIQAREHGQSTQRLAPIAALFIKSAPLGSLDDWLDKTPSSQEALEALSIAGNHLATCSVLHQVLSRPALQALLGETNVTQLAIAGCMHGYAQDTLEVTGLDLATTMTFLGADLMGERALPDLIAHLPCFAQEEVRTLLVSRLPEAYATLGGERIATVMGRLGWPEFTHPLIDALADDQGDYLCEAAMTALVKIGAPARNGLIARWAALDSSQRIYGLSVIQDVGGDATADFASRHFDELLREDIESACELFKATPDERLLKQLHPHLRRKDTFIDSAYVTLAMLLDQNDEDSRQAYARVTAEEERSKALRARFNQGDLRREELALDLRCPACGETNNYLVAGVVAPGEGNSTLPYLVEDEIPCASCGQEVEFEFTTKAVLALAAEMLLIQAAGNIQQDRGPMIRLLNAQIDGHVMPIAAALQKIRQRIEDNPADSRSGFRLANMLIALNRPRAALSALGKTAVHGPHILDIIVFRAQLLASQGRETESLDSLIQAMGLQPTWQVWGNAHSLGQEFVELYNNLLRTQEKWELPALHPAIFKSLQHTKVGRNDPCPCGSGKKHKKCCG